MSLFAVEKRKISKVWSHPNADRLDLAMVDGLDYQFISQKGTQTEGNIVAYFPIDSILPENLIEHFGIKNMMAGKDKNRIKTVKLRGSFGQGFVSNINSICDFLKKSGQEFTPETLPDDLTELLHVTKYEIPEMIVQNAKLIKLDVKAYDIEGISRYKNVVDYLISSNKEILISEKLEGSNFSLLLKSNGEVKIAQRNFYIESNDPNKPHSFELVGKRDVLPLAQKLQNEKFQGCDIRIRGEFLGSIQGNIYYLKNNIIKVFEIDVNGKPIDAIDLIELVKEYSIDFVPILFVGHINDFLNGKTIQEMSHGKSKLYDTLREGIVIRPYREEYNKDLDSRLILKHRSEEYLAKNDL